MTQEKPPHAYDVRVLDRMVKRGVLTPEERDKYINKLPDVADKAERDDDEEDDKD
ncbi:MAG TPA: hypothetical protein VG389_24945 [Myxococcota bacterium]|jgi:polyhydroxyalkanoate synthesis regulator phasin|nr:hypothetical protein [Myxococcota bacterium]